MGLNRPRVQALMAGAWERRVTLLIAGGGYGKTTAGRLLSAGGPVRRLALRAADREVATLASRLATALDVEGMAPAGGAAMIGAEDRFALADQVASTLSAELEARSGPLMLVLDDIEHLVDAAPAAQLIRNLCLQAPAHLHLVLSGRSLPALGLGAASPAGDVLEIAAPDLAFTPAETAELLATRLGVRDEALARKCRSLTGGWPAALQLMVDRLERVDPEQWRATLDKLPLLRGQHWSEFVADLLDRESPEGQRILAAASVAPLVHTELLVELGVERPEAELASLQTRGLLVATAEDEGRAISPVLSEFVAARLTPAESEELRDQVAGWLESMDHLGEALESRATGGVAPTRSYLERRGHDLIARGFATRVVEVLAAAGTEGSVALEAVLGEALVSLGEWDAAMERFRIVRGATDGGHLRPETAWRFGALLYLRGEAAEAIEVLSAAHSETGSSPDDALVSAWLSSAFWSRGESDRASALATVALRQADRGSDPVARAAAHVAAALVAASAGDRELNERHYRSAVAAATRAGDAIQLARIHANLSSRALEEGDYARALEEADRGLSAGAGHKFFGALALCNKADALMHLGELEEAHAALLAAIEAYSALGSLLECAPHSLLGELYRERGDLARARTEFERAVRLAEQAEDAHTLVYALCGLARTTAADDPDRARERAGHAVALSSSLELPRALCTAAWIELGAGALQPARELATEAAGEARRTGDRPALAEALALLGLAGAPSAEGNLRAAIELWEQLGDPIAPRRARLVLAVRDGDETAAAALRRQLSDRGVAAVLGAERVDPRPAHQALSIRTLGEFAVVREGERLPPSAWQSRKARDLLKLLVARRGRPITREGAAEALWPGEPPGPTSNRLSVALSTLRKVLDPERSRGSDHFIAADAASLSLRPDRVAVDVVEFLDASEAGIAAAARDDWATAEPLLRQAERLYTGEFLEEDLYEDWAVDCREAARSAALEVSRLLARAASDAGDDDDASRHLRRLLERDPYDEDAWLALVAAQSRLRRYGEARRQHAIYARRMEELQVAPVPLARAVATSRDALRPH